MSVITTRGIVIAVHRSSVGLVLGIDIFTSEYGILHWFTKEPPLVRSIEYLFMDMSVSGDQATATAGNLISYETHRNNASDMLNNNSFHHGVALVQTLRAMVFDGVKLTHLFKIITQAIKNFSSGFNPDVVLLKALYLLCRSEGYAVDAIWLPSLSPADRALTKHIIHSKHDLITPEHVKTVIWSLQTWILSI